MLEMTAGRILADGDRWGRHFGRYHPHWWGILALLLLTGAAVALVVWIVLRLTRRQTQPPVGTGVVGTRPDSALEELRLRYARGEVDRDSFLRAASDLGAPAVPGPVAGHPGPVAPDDTKPA